MSVTLLQALQLLGLFLLGCAAILVLLYVYRLGRELVIALLLNYGLKRAHRCHASHCGFYVALGPYEKQCLHPEVSQRAFRKRQRGGDSRGCRHSVQLREEADNRKPAQSYLEDYMRVRGHFSILDSWWKLAMLLLLMGVLALGAINPEEVLEFLW